MYQCIKISGVIKEEEQILKGTNKVPQSQPNNPLHGVKLATIVEFLYEKYGWEELDRRMKMNCFHSNPSVKSTLKFLRKTDWAREKIERLYLRSI